jgi:hypothetical protein
MAEYGRIILLHVVDVGRRRFGESNSCETEVFSVLLLVIL